MGADISTLGMAVDSAAVVRATEALDRLASAADKAADQSTGMEKAFGRAATEGYVLGDAITSTVRQTIQAVEAFVRLGLEVGRYQDIAEKTTSDPAGLASMRTAADVAGTSIETVGLAINRMALQLSKVDDEGKGAGKALASIGLELEAFKRLRPDQQFKELAKALEGYADTQTKVAVVQSITGRSGAEQLPFLKELANQTEQNNLLTTQQIKLADDLADSYERTRSQTKQVAEILAVSTLPALDAVTNAIKDQIIEIIGLDKATGKLDATPVQEFAFTIVRAFAYAVDEARKSVGEFIVLGKSVGAIGAAFQQFFATSGMTPDGKDQAIENIKEIGRAWREDVGSVADSFIKGKSFVERVDEEIAKIRQRLNPQQTTGDFTRADRAASKPEINFSGVNAKLKETKDVYQSLIERVRAFTAEQTAEAAQLEKLSAGQRLQISIYEKLDELGNKVSVTKKVEIDAAIQEALAIEKTNIARERRKKLDEENAKITQRALEEEFRHLVQTEQLAQAAIDEADALGKTRAQLDAVEISRLRDAAAMLRLQAATAEGEGLGRQYNQMLLQQADALDQAANARLRRAEYEKRYAEDALGGAQRAVQKYMDSVKEMGIETERSVSGVLGTIEDSLTELSVKGATDTKRLITTIISEFNRLVIIKPLMAQIFGNGSGGYADWIGKLFSLFGASGGGASSLGFSSTNAGLNDPGFGVSASSSRQSAASFQGGPTYITIDSRTDQAQVAQLVAEGVQQGNQAMAEHLQSMGVL